MNPTGAWTEAPAASARSRCSFATIAPRASRTRGPADFDYLHCVGPDQFVKDVFLDSDTDLMVLSFVPSTREGEPLTIAGGRGDRARSSRSWTARIACSSTAA